MKLNKPTIFIYIPPKAPENTQSYNRYAYCFNNPFKFTDPSGYLASNNVRMNLTDNPVGNSSDPSYYVDGIKVSASVYRGFSGAGFFSAYGNSSFVAENLYQQFLSEKNRYVEPVYVGVSDGAFGKDGLFHSSRGNSSRTGLYGGMYNGSPFFTNSAQSLSQNNGYLSGLALADGGNSISFSLINHWFSKPVSDVEIESNNPNYPGVTISYDMDRRMGFYNPFTKTIHVGEKSYMKGDQAWLQHEYGHYLQYIGLGMRYLSGVMIKSGLSATINTSYYHDRIAVELEATLFAHNFFTLNGKSYLQNIPNTSNTKAVGIFDYSRQQGRNNQKSFIICGPF